MLFVLASIHFCHLLDFVIMMPLGPQFMRVFAIGSAEFGALVSAYAISAGVAGLAASFFLDRVGRKRALSFLLVGFAVGTFACGLAPDYYTLLLARIATGAFGGILGAQIMAAIGDLFPPERRGTATGIVLSAFSVASVAGVPIGLYFAAHYGWRWPFLAIAVLGLGLFALAAKVLPPMHATPRTGPVAFWHEPARVLSRPNAWIAFALLLFIVLTSFSVIPYIAPYLVSNVGLSETQLPLVYLAGGGATFFTSRLVGRASDHYGKRRVFLVMAFLALLPILALTHLPPVALPLVILVTTAFFILVSGRVVPAWAMVTGSVPAENRGSFMSLVSAVQQFSIGLASLIGGLIVTENQGGRLGNYPLVGYLAICTTLIALGLALRLRPAETAGF